MLYFAYGSNMLHSRLVSRVGECRILKTDTLRDHRLVFNKISNDGAKANITPHFDANVQGVVYVLTTSQILTLDTFEGGYTRVKRRLLSGVWAQVYISSKIDNTLCTSLEYLNIVVQGALSHGIKEI